MQKHTYKNKLFVHKKAFTLIELLIVIAIIGILFIVLVSKVDFATDKAKTTGVQTDFRSFQMAFDTVAKENAGFNTFGWDTGDANQDGIRNSYDEGDNGAGGGIAKNGIQDGDEVFTGHKVYDETFTKVFSLKKNGTGDYDREALNRLETAINANLDPKLHITIKDDGEIVMANGAQDPWNKEYHGWYIANAEVDKKDRGAIVMYSDGANNEFGSEHKISNGIVSISIPGNNKFGKDDYALAVVYTYTNGYGEVKTITSGFSGNQGYSNESNNSDLIEDELDVLIQGFEGKTFIALSPNAYISPDANEFSGVNLHEMCFEMVDVRYSIFITFEDGKIMNGDGLYYSNDNVFLTSWCGELNKDELKEMMLNGLISYDSDNLLSMILYEDGVVSYEGNFFSVDNTKFFDSEQFNNAVVDLELVEFNGLLEDSVYYANYGEQKQFTNSYIEKDGDKFIVVADPNDFGFIEYEYTEWFNIPLDAVEIVTLGSLFYEGAMVTSGITIRPIFDFN